MTKLVEFIPNFSEGRRQEVIDQISEAAQSVPRCQTYQCQC